MTVRNVPTSELDNSVIKNGFCIGCGICAAMDKRIEMRWDQYGRIVAQDDSSPGSPVAARVCPFSEVSENEDVISREAFGENVRHDEYIGRHLATYAGWVADDGYREAGSSGGLVSWLLVELLTRGVVDGVVHVKATTSKTPGDPLFQYTVSRSANEIREGAKSRYYPVEMSGAIAEILSRPGRYAVVGVPCFIKGVRLACRESEELRARVAVTVAIVCGHLKTSGFAEFLAWQCGVAPSELRAIDFRSKIKNQSASSYGISIVGERNGLKKVVDRPMSALQGSNWGHGLFKFKACDFCDDVVGETADISVGDAWLPEYESDWRGTNVVVVRSALIKSIISEAIDAGSLAMNHLPIDKVVASQAGGFRHRRDGLAYRLHREDAAKRWRPPKRVLPSVEHLNARQKDIYELRYRISELSHQAFATAKELQDCSIFMKEIGPLLSRYDRHFRKSIVHRVVGKVRKAARFLTGKG